MRIPWATQRKIWAYVFLSVPFLYFLAVNFGAMLAAFSYSFQNYNTLSSVRTFAGLNNYRGLFSDGAFLQSLRNTIMFAVIRVPSVIVLSLGVALLLASIKRCKGFFRMLYFMPFVTSGVAIAWVFRFMYLPNFGLFTAVCDFLNMPRVDFLGNPRTALPSIAATDGCE
jgi:multiple sugar transport system permease protein